MDIKSEAAGMMRAAIALQVATLEWDGDETPTQGEARQALLGMQEALNAANLAFGKMKRATEKRRHGR